MSCRLSFIDRNPLEKGALACMAFPRTVPHARCLGVLLLSLLPALPAAAQNPYIAVIEKIAGAVGFFAEDGGLLAQVKVGNFPHEAALSADGRLLYVSDNGVLWMTDDGAGANS